MGIRGARRREAGKEDKKDNDTRGKGGDRAGGRKAFILSRNRRKSFPWQRKRQRHDRNAMQGRTWREGQRLVKTSLASFCANTNIFDPQINKILKN